MTHEELRRLQLELFRNRLAKLFEGVTKVNASGEKVIGCDNGARRALDASRRRKSK